jgi:hypothetical protein
VSAFTSQLSTLIIALKSTDAELGKVCFLEFRLLRIAKCRDKKSTFRKHRVIHGRKRKANKTKSLGDMSFFADASLFDYHDSLGQIRRPAFLDSIWHGCVRCALVGNRNIFTWQQRPVFCVPWRRFFGTHLVQISTVSK